MNPSIHYRFQVLNKKFRITPCIMDDFGTLIETSWYAIAISINAYRTDFS